VIAHAPDTRPADAETLSDLAITETPNLDVCGINPASGCGSRKCGGSNSGFA